MRRFASVFIPKLNTSDSLSRQPNSSSASSSASTSVSAHTSPSPSTHKKSWFPSWLPKKSKSHPIVRPSIPDWNPLSTPNILPVHVDTDDDTSEDSDDDDDNDDDDEDNDNDNDNDDDDHDHYHQPVPSPPAASTPVDYLHSLISASLAHVPSSPPLLHIPGTSLFPRSSNPPHQLPYKDSLRSRMLKSRLLSRLSNLSSADHIHLLPFSNKPVPSSTNRPTAPPIDEPAIDPSLLSSASHGLRQWIARPCFEDRFSVLLLSDNSTTITTHVVTGSGFAVAELEFSEALESLAGLDSLHPNQLATDSQLEQSPPREEEPEPPSLSSSLLSVPVVPRNAPYKALPSPLRMQHSPPAIQVSPVPSTTTTPSTTSMPTPPAEPNPPQVAVVKRGVRFAEDGKEDQTPLAYVHRIQKQREEKARFLREERERRAWEEECRKQERERMEREKERREWERERKAWELEKKAMEEERKARLYAEEVAAARLRRESARAGGGQALPLSVASTPTLAIRDPENRLTRDSRSYSRPAYDAQRRYVSESAVPTSTEYGSGSRPSSIGHGGASPSGSGSRPPSLYSSLSSSEDGRQREAAAAGSSRSKKRASISSSMDHRSSSYTGGSNLIPPVPPVPPPFALDVPLLPPTPPFMMQQYSHRPRSLQSSSSGSSKQKLLRKDSADRVDLAQQQQQQQQPQQQRMHNKQNGSTSPAAKTAQQQQQQQRRRASGENFTPSRSSDRGRMTRSSVSAHSHSQPSSYSRGTAPQLASFMPAGPSYSYPQSPWTALPTMAQLHSMTLNTRPQLGPRQTAIS